MLFFLIFSGGISLCILFSLIFFNCCFLHQLLNMCPLYFFCIFMISPSEGILILVSFCLLIFLFVFCSIRYHYTIIILIEFSLLIFASLVYSRCSNFLFWSNILSHHLIHYFIFSEIVLVVDYDEIFDLSLSLNIFMWWMGYSDELFIIKVWIW